MSEPTHPASIAALSKIELHRHLEGSVRLDTLVDVARQYDLDLPARTADGLRSFVQIAPDETHDAAHFLKKFAVLRGFFCSPEVIRRVAREAVIDAANDQIRYLELRFTPKALAKLKNYTFYEVIEWVCEAVAEAQSDYPIKVRLIVAVNRHESVGDAERQMRAALDHKAKGVVGLDLCGQEVGFPATPFYDVFRQARQDGLGITIHAGEWDRPTNVRDAIEHLGATRIGHGVRVIEDSAVVRLARDAGITFEVCPTSNVQSGVIRDIQQHPLRDMVSIGLRTTINTDDPSISNITLTQEMELARDVLGLSVAELRQCELNAAEAAFLPASERALLIQQIEAAIPSVQMFQIGDIQIALLTDGVVHVDAGGPFGLSPRVLYKNFLTPNADNLIPMTLNCLLVRTAGKTIVVDTGLGDKLTEKQRQNWGLVRPEGTLIDGLARLGVTPGDVDLVIDTHLHGDHCSGNTQFMGDGASIQPTFPNAEYVVQRREYEDAMRPNERTRATYLPINYQPLVASGQMHLLDGDTEIVPGIHGVIAPGHTPAMMVIRFESGGQHALFVTDLAAYTIHFERLAWMTAYDVEPLITLETKRTWQAWARDTNALLIFQHDPMTLAGHYSNDGKIIPVTADYDR